MYEFITYVAAWLPDILVESSTGTRPSVNGLSDVTWMSAIRWVTNSNLPLVFTNDIRYTEIALIMRVREIIEMNYWDVDIS